MATHSSTPAWKIPRAEETGGLQSMVSLRVGHDWATSLSRIREGNGNPLQGSCLENPRDGRAWWAAVSGVRVRHDWSDATAAAAAAGEWNPFLLLWAQSINNTYCLTIDLLWDARQILFYTLGLGFPICKGYFVSVVVYSLSSIWLFCYPMDCRLPSSSVHKISQTRILEGVAILSPRDLPDPGVKPMSLVFAGWFFPTEPLLLLLLLSHFSHVRLCTTS